MKLLSFLFFTILAFANIFCFSQKKSNLLKPNIIYILADDLGYGDVKVNNPNGKIQTFNIDKLAKNGMQFTDAHSGSSVCTPTRYGILTGRYSWRLKLQSSVLDAYSFPLIDTSTFTLPLLLKQQGYKTACVGKWHLWLGWQGKVGKTPSVIKWEEGDIDFTKPILTSPIRYGFDYFFGVGASLDMPPYDFIKNDRVIHSDLELFEPSTKGTYIRKGLKYNEFDFDSALEMLTNETLDFIEKNKNAPFFIYLPLLSPHTPIVPSKNFKGKSGINDYADYVLETDWVVGQIDSFLIKNKLSENTLIIFSSDNGSAPNADSTTLNKFQHNPNYIFRGAKADIFEGGHRVPFFVKWPNRIKSGSICNTTICLTDIIQTVSDLLNTTIPENAAPDSYSFLPLLLNDKNKNYRPAIIHHSINGNFAIRQGNWKLIIGAGSGGWSIPTNEEATQQGLPKFQLYNLLKDPSEKQNLETTYPKKVKQLYFLLQKYISEGRSTKGKSLHNDVDIDVWKNNN